MVTSPLRATTFSERWSETPKNATKRYALSIALESNDFREVPFARVALPSTSRVHVRRNVRKAERPKTPKRWWL